MAMVRRAFFRDELYGGGTLLVDLVLDDRRRWNDRVATFGCWGKFDSDDVWPFMLKKGGEIDFGNTAAAPDTKEDRFAEFDIGDDRIIAEGECYELVYGGRFPMRLEKLTDLSAI